MDEKEKELTDKLLLDALYGNNLYCIKSICKELNIWDSYSEQQQHILENITSIDSRLNRNYSFDEGYDYDLYYNELTRKGVNDLYEIISLYKKITNTDVFIDVGSGCGKLLMNLSIISDLKTLVGLEILKERHLYASYIKEKIMPNNKKIFLYNIDFKMFNIGIGTILFFNNMYMSSNTINSFIDKLPSKCHIISFRDLNIDGFRNKFTLNTTIGDVKCNYYIFNKK